MNDMPSQKRSINVRLTDDDAAEFDALQRELSAKLELELSQSDLVRLALRALRRENPASTERKKGAK